MNLNSIKSESKMNYELIESEYALTENELK